MILFYLEGDFSQSYVLLEKLGQGSYSTVKLGLEIVRIIFNCYY